MTHLINKLQFEMKCMDENQAFNLRQHFAQTLQNSIIAAVDEVCSKYVQDDEWIRIDKLEINLGKFSPAAFDNHFPESFLYHFEKALTEKLPDAASPQRQ